MELEWRWREKSVWNSCHKIQYTDPQQSRGRVDPYQATPGRQQTEREPKGVETQAKLRRQKPGSGGPRGSNSFMGPRPRQWSAGMGIAGVTKDQGGDGGKKEPDRARVMEGQGAAKGVERPWWRQADNCLRWS